MLKKITKINNILSYNSFIWDTLNKVQFTDNKGHLIYTKSEFKKNNVIFAENGNGKSNLINIFKVLNGDDTYKLEKHWDFSNSHQEIELELANNIVFNQNNWEQISGFLKREIIIFDKEFIETYVQSTGLGPHNTAERKQSRGKQIIYLGDFENYNKVVNKIDTIKNDLTVRNKSFIDNEIKAIKSILPENYDIKELIKNQKSVINSDPATLEQKNRERELLIEQISKIQTAIKDSSDIDKLTGLIKGEDLFSMILLPVQKGDESNMIVENIDPQQLLGFSISTGIAETLTKIVNKKPFIRSGIDLITDTTENCPFCEQKIKNDNFIQIIKDYKSIFDEDFLLQEEELQKSLLTYLNALRSLLMLGESSSNTTNIPKLKKYLQFEKELPKFNLTKEQKECLQSEIELIIKKQKDTLTIQTSNNYKNIQSIAILGRDFVSEYNKSITRINEELEKLKKDSKEGKLSIKKEELEKQLTSKKEAIIFIEHKNSFTNYFNTVKIFNENQAIVNSLEEIYQKTKTQIVTEFDLFVKEYFKEIKDIVKQLSPTMDIFEITGEGNYSRTGKESALCGFKVTYNGEEKTKSLSEGEKQVLALAYFLAQLRKTTDTKKIIIFDDPITAFDAGKRKATAEVIHNEVKKFEQLFIFTCDPLFREFCLKELSDRNFYYIFKTLKNSSIQYVHPKRETIYSAFEEDFRNIDSVSGTLENVVLYGQKLRFCLETKIKEEYFGYSEDSLSNMIEKVSKKGSESFDSLINNKDTIISLYKYCNTGGLAHYPRDGSTSWNELKTKITQYLSLNL